LAIVSVTDLLASGVHFGHRVSRWNPKMKPFIYGKRNLIHIIDLKETLRGVIRAYRFLAGVVESGEDILFVGTKRQARSTVEAEAKRAGMPYVCERWLGGTLTNFYTIRSRLRRLIEIEKLEESGEIDLMSKKAVARMMREKRKLMRNLSGIREMNRVPGAMVVIDPHHEGNAVREAKRLDIPVVALIDTDSDPDFVDIPIPGNDDAMRSIVIVCQKLADAVIDGKSRRAGSMMAAAKAEEAPTAAPTPAPAPPPASEPAQAAEVVAGVAEPAPIEAAPADDGAEGAVTSEGEDDATSEAKTDAAPAEQA